jgi:hypothetical protein
MPHPPAPKHLWLALSPHGYGHAAMTAPVVEALRRRVPDLRLTIQTSVSRSLLEERYGPDFTHVSEIPDFGLRMLSATEVDVETSAEAYRRQHADFSGLVESEARRLRAAHPDVVLANVPYVTLAAARRAGIPSVALSSLQWADMYRHYLGHLPEAGPILADIVSAYHSASAFLRVTPAMEMPSLDNVVHIGVVGRRGRDRRDELGRKLAGRVGLVAFGGIDHDLAMEHWPRLDGWTWLSAQDCPPNRGDILPWTGAGMPFNDLTASVDVIITKPGYGTFTEAGMAGTPVLFITRADWPECPSLDVWLMRHTRAVAVAPQELIDGLESQLHKLFSLPPQVVAEAAGNEEAADFIERMLYAEEAVCESS